MHFCMLKHVLCPNKSITLAVKFGDKAGEANKDKPEGEGENPSEFSDLACFRIVAQWRHF